MKAARIHEYNNPVVLEDVPIPDIQPDEILVQVKACGMCRSDAQLIDGYFRPFADIPTPITTGHEISGVVHKIGSSVPKVITFSGGIPIKSPDGKVIGAIGVSGSTVENDRAVALAGAAASLGVTG